ncbi:2-hydroxyacid dehydrogenase [Rhodovulum euryhalinum]|uniref:Hydroxypyruvate reductase n=1 Tax=Rhodovulum euryhalinum TaxID=35805 RepID=A0A4R2KM69_9RHOB|nr:D-glycerate dehydrogenase [Rhodovulum euryhalinum]TCO71128.1 hydroxypyruvate reductase [Rhodovulum euryhalinum]
MTRILVTRPMPGRVGPAVQALGEVEMRDSNLPLSDAELRRALTDFDIVLPTLGDRFSAGVFADAGQPRARLLANFGMGYNHIDVAAARAFGIAVTNTPGAVTDATADVGMLLILMTCRRASEGERMLRAGQWTGWHPTQMLGLHVTGKTVGIIGMGNIGQALARRCHYGFGMNVVYYTRSPRALDFPATPVDSLAALGAASDVVVSCVPGGAETRHMMGADLFAAMRPHAHFVNISRGDVVDEAALVAALSEGRIAGAGLDVYEFEPQVPEALVAMENVALLPHLGTATLEVRDSMGMMAVENIRAFLAGAALPNPV